MDICSFGDALGFKINNYNKLLIKKRILKCRVNNNLVIIQRLFWNYELEYRKIVI